MATATKLSDAEIAGLVVAAGWTGADVSIGVAIALAESGGNPRAYNGSNSNGSNDAGLFQINSIHTALRASGDVYNPADNTRMARTVYTDAGNKWTPWSTYNNRSYVVYLSRGQAASGNPVTGTIPPGGSAGLTGGDDSALVPDFIEALAEPHLWLRVAMFVGGGLVTMIALSRLTGLSPLDATPLKVLTK